MSTMFSVRRAALAPVLVALLALVAAAPAFASSPVIGCYIDTEFFDYPTEGGCSGSAAESPTDTASFEVMHVTWNSSDYSVSWQNGCDSSSGNWCVIALPLGCTTQTATVTNLNTQATTTSSATACLWK
jgi:hypothetical protein